MGDLISSSPAAGAPEGGGNTVGIPKAPAGGKYAWTEGSSNWGAALPVCRLSFILKSCFSISNSAIEFFFMRSMIALMSFRSTRILLLPGRKSVVLSRSLSKKAVADLRALLRDFQIRVRPYGAASGPSSSKRENEENGKNRQKRPNRGVNQTTLT